MTTKHTWTMVAAAAICAAIAPAAAIAKKRPPPTEAAARFTVTDSGATGKPDIVIIPGLTSSREAWAGETAALAPDYRVHVLQIAGFAGAPAGPNATGDILPAIVDQLHVYITGHHLHPVVIGHSLGGLITLMLAAKYPDDVAKAVIVDALPFYGMLFGPAATVDSVKSQAEKMRDGLLAMTADQADRGAEQTAAALAIDPTGRKLVAHDAKTSDRAVFAHAMFEDLQTDMRPALPTIATPTLMLYPFDEVAQGKDPTIIDALYVGAYQPMPHGKLVRIDKARHFIMLDQPKQVDAAIRAFIKSAP